MSYDFTQEFIDDAKTALSGSTGGGTIDIVARTSIEQHVDDDNVHHTVDDITEVVNVKVAEVVNGAPTTLDTLAEIADAMANNQTVVEALDAAIGSKTDKTDFIAHADDADIHVTEADKTAWNDKVDADVLAAHVDDTDIHLTAAKAVEAVAAVIPNPNLLINGGLNINQRGELEYSAIPTPCYCIDGWRCRGKAVVTPTNVGLKIACGDVSEPAAHSFITHTVEDGYRLAGMTVTFSVEIVEMNSSRGMISIWAGDGSSEETAVGFTAFTTVGKVVVTAEIPTGSTVVMVRIDGARSGSAVGDYSIPRYAKLEVGNIATVFSPPDPATELARCQRYYQVRTTGDIDPNDLRPSMATITDVKQRGDGLYEYCADI